MSIISKHSINVNESFNQRGPCKKLKVKKKKKDPCLEVLSIFYKRKNANDENLINEYQDKTKNDSKNLIILFLEAMNDQAGSKNHISKRKKSFIDSLITGSGM